MQIKINFHHNYMKTHRCEHKFVFLTLSNFIQLYMIISIGSFHLRHFYDLFSSLFQNFKSPNILFEFNESGSHTATVT